MSGKRLLNVQETAEYIGSTPLSVYGRVSKGTIPYVKMGRAVRFDRIDLDLWIEAMKRGYKTDHQRA